MRGPVPGRQKRPAMESKSSSMPTTDVPASSPLPHRQSPFSHSLTTMQHSALFLLLLLLLAVSPLTTTEVEFVECTGGLYTANSTYEVNLRRLAAILPVEAASSPNLQAFRGVGYWPNRLRGFSLCYRQQGVSSSSCAACLADAFREAERACPYGKKMLVHARGNCTLSLADFPRSVPFFFGRTSWFEYLGAGLVFQAIGFAWLFFLLLQEWRDKRRGSMMRSSPIPSGDQ